MAVPKSKNKQSHFKKKYQTYIARAKKLSRTSAKYTLNVFHVKY